MGYETASAEESRDNRASFDAHLAKLLSGNEAVILAADKKTKALLKKDAPDPREFTDVLSAADIEADIKKAGEMHAKFAKRGLLDKLAFAAEAILYQQIGVSEWLSTEGVKTYVEKTADADDVLRGTDLVIEFEAKEGAEPVAVNVDLTIGANTLDNKIRAIKNSIDDGTLAEVRYHTEPDGTHKPLVKTPKVVLGISAEKAAELAKLWVSEDKEDVKRLREHPVQLALARQIHLQLKAYEEYARANALPDLAERFGKARNTVEKVLAEKESKFKNDASMANEDSLFELRIALRSRLAGPAREDKPYNAENLARKYR